MTNLKRLKKLILFIMIALFITAAYTGKTAFAQTSHFLTEPDVNSKYYGTIIDEAANTVKINAASPMQFTHLVFVDPNGNDSTGNGSASRPYQTLLKAMSKLWSSGDKYSPSAVILNDGSYNWYPLATGDSCNLNNNFNGMNVSFIARNLGHVSFTSPHFELLTSENSSSSAEILKFYGIIFDGGSASDNYTQCHSYMHMDGDPRPNEFYNCVFRCLGMGGLFKYSNSYPNPKIYNCLYINCYESYNSKPISSATVMNCASSNSYIEPIRVAKTTALYNVKFDDAFRIVSTESRNLGTGTNPDGTTANIGVYGGTYSWRNPELDYIYNIQTLSHSYNLNDNFSAALTIKNIHNVGAQSITITYDSSKLQLSSVSGLDERLHYLKNKLSDGKVELCLVTNSKDTYINSKATLLTLNFKCINKGSSYISVNSGSLSNRKSAIEDLLPNQLGRNMITVK